MFSKYDRVILIFHEIDIFESNRKNNVSHRPWTTLYLSDFCVTISLVPNISNEHETFSLFFQLPENQNTSKN